MNIFKKEKTLLADVFLRLRTPKNVVTWMFKNSRFRLPFQKQHGTPVPTLFKSERQNLCHIYWSIWRQLGCKKAPLVRCKILRLFVNTLSADDKYSLLNRVSLTQPIQMQLSEKQKTFSWYFFAILKCSFYFELFQKKDDPKSWCSSEITDSGTHSSDYPSKRNMVHRSQHFPNLNNKTCTIPFDQCEGSWVAKTLC